VYERAASHEFIGTFKIHGAKMTDGLEVCNADLGPLFPQGLLACHTAQGNCPVLLTPWETVVSTFPFELKIDSSWSRPR